MNGLKLFAVIALLFIVPVGLFRAFGGGVAPKPGVFRDKVTLASAIEESKRSGRPVIAFATADWCPPCQVMKKETLIDSRVATFLDSKSIPVYVDIDHDKPAAERLQVTGIPTTVVIAGDTVVARTSGYLSAENYLSFLEAAVDLAQNPAELERVRAESEAARRR